MFMGKKKIVAMALAGMMSFGIAGMAVNASTAEAAIKPAYEDGTHNQFSHRLKEEERVHNQNVRALKYQKKKGEISEKEFNKEMKREQKRHDRVVNNVKSDYEKYQHRHH